MTRLPTFLHQHASLDSAMVTSTIPHANSVSHGNLNDELVPHITHDPETGLPWPEPTIPEPDFVALALFIFDAVAVSTDGCLAEPDGVCQHGHPSWLRRLGVI